MARLPQAPLLIEGDLIVRRPRGVVVNTLRFEMHLAWGQEPAEALYIIRDAFGVELERLTLKRHADGVLETDYAAGDPARPAPAPSLQQRIQNTDFSWADLTLAFLWWPEARLVGTDRLRGRTCHLVDAYAPDARDGASTGTAPYARVRAWVDQEMYMLLQAEAQDAQGHPLRTLWVRSFRKTNDRWMIKDLEIQSYPLVHRTRLHVRHFRELEPGTAEDADENRDEDQGEDPREDDEGLM